MNIHTRNQDIVARHVGGETLAAIAAGYGISRERARQIFEAHATDEDRTRLATPAPTPPPKPTDFPKGEGRIRVHVPFARNTDISQKQVRAGIRRWLAGEFEIDLSARGTRRFGPVMAESMHVKLSVKCTSSNIPIATAVRGIIAYLENENAQSHE
jgi:hypothetical protein